MDKITIEVDDLSKVSDGYHTIAELYDHRCLLWINLVLALRNDYCTYLIKDHYDGWFLLGLVSSNGQISYHCPNKYLDLVEKHIGEYPNLGYDGHTSSDVLNRLINLATEVI